MRLRDTVFFPKPAWPPRQLQLGQNLAMLTGVLGVGAGLIALYLVRVGYLQDKAQRNAGGQGPRGKDAGEKSAFLANMSHEIRTPMNAILDLANCWMASSLLQNKPNMWFHSPKWELLLRLINDVRIFQI